MQNLELIMTLLNIKGLGRKTISKIIKNNDLNTLHKNELLNYLISTNLKNTSNITKNDIDLSYEIAQKTIETCNNQDIKILSILEGDFPQNLKNMNDNPVLIYYKGNKDCLTQKSIAVIGTRNPSLHGANISCKISSILSQKGYTIVSGLANGCDTFAHLGALKNKGKTIAVMPCGLDKVYPKTNQNLFEQIINCGGCAISEYTPGQTVSKYRLIERDRLQSGLSQGVVVIETSINGGSFHAINHALTNNKIVACYKHDPKYTNLKSVQGNLKLLEDDRVVHIYDNCSIKKFINKIEYIFKNENIKKNNEQTYQGFEQLKFELL